MSGLTMQDSTPKPPANSVKTISPLNDSVIFASHRGRQDMFSNSGERPQMDSKYRHHHPQFQPQGQLQQRQMRQ